MTGQRWLVLAFLPGLLGACGGRTLLQHLPSEGGLASDRRGDSSLDLDSARPGNPAPDDARPGAADATVAPRTDGGADAAPDVATREARGDKVSDVGSELPAYLIGIELSPPIVTIAVDMPYGGFAVTALYSDGSTMDVTAEASFTAADTGVAEVSGRTVTGQKEGVTTIKAQHYSQTASARVTVTASHLLAIGIEGLTSIPVGQTIYVTAIGVFTDGSRQDITAAVAWTVSDSGLATASVEASTGKERITGARAGSGTVTATLAGVTATASLTVTSAVMNRIELTPTQTIMQQGLLARFNATAIYSDGSTGDVTLRASWSSSNNASARVDVDSAGAIVTAVGPGASTITAGIGAGDSAILGSTVVTVTTPTLESIVAYPTGMLWAIVGRTEAFSAVGTYSDGSKADVTLAATWSSSDSTIVPVSNALGDKGVATPLAVGSATIRATFSGVSASVRVDVLDAPLVRIDVTPEPQTVALGLKARMVATGTFEDRATRDLTAQVAWTVSDPSIATVSNAPGTAGQVTGVGVGTTTVSASYGTTRGKATVKVTKGKLLAISISPSSATVTAGAKANFQAIGKLDDGTTPDLTAQVTWFVRDLSVAQLSNAPGNQGVATALLAGTATFTASLGGISATATLSVGEPLLASLMVSPTSASIWIGNTETFVATAIYQNGATAVVDGEWRSSDPVVATVSARAGGRRAIATGVTTGTTLITAAYQGQTASALLTVAAEAKLSEVTSADVTRYSVTERAQ